MTGRTGLPRGPKGTIYEKEKGFDDNLRIEINSTKIKFIKDLKSSETSSIFHVNYDDKSRVLKVVCVLIFAASQIFQCLILFSFTTMKTLNMLMMKCVI